MGGEICVEPPLLAMSPKLKCADERAVGSTQFKGRAIGISLTTKSTFIDIYSVYIDIKHMKQFIGS